MKTINVTDENFEEVITGKDKTILVDFGAEWCAPCRAMKPVIETLASEFEGKATVATLDVDLNPQHTALYGVRNLPTFLIFKNGELAERIVGAVPKTVLEKKLLSLV